jgi:hypothetical protein
MEEIEVSVRDRQKRHDNKNYPANNMKPDGVAFQEFHQYGIRIVHIKP